MLLMNLHTKCKVERQKGKKLQLYTIKSKSGERTHFASSENCMFFVCNLYKEPSVFSSLTKVAAETLQKSMFCLVLIVFFTLFYKGLIFHITCQDNF